jgi:hypothetical protein
MSLGDTTLDPGPFFYRKLTQRLRLVLCWILLEITVSIIIE